LTLGIIFIVLAIIFGSNYGAEIQQHFRGFSRHRKSKSKIKFDHISHDILIEHVEFYVKLPEHHQIQFRKDVAWFLGCTRVVGVDIPVGPVDEHLVAASAIIPIFYFEDWEYYDLHEVQLFKSSFNFEFKTNEPDSQIMGLVGTGEMEGIMALSIEALHDGFLNREDRQNTGVHEFIHLLDKADGRIDGLPKKLIEYSYALPWLNLIRHKMNQVNQGQSEIDAYAGLNLAEFFAVTSEYFFERPEELKEHHPELYEQLDKMFRGNLKNSSAE
jgi:hypothetical protein